LAGQSGEFSIVVLWLGEMSDGDFVGMYKIVMMCEGDFVDTYENKMLYIINSYVLAAILCEGLPAKMAQINKGFHGNYLTTNQ
jgi:hypothetical protein